MHILQVYFEIKSLTNVSSNDISYTSSINMQD